VIVTEVGSKTDGVLTVFLAKFIKVSDNHRAQPVLFHAAWASGHFFSHGDRICCFFPSVLCDFFVVTPQVLLLQARSQSYL